MGKKNKSKGGLGRALINDRFGKSNTARRTKDPSVLHSSEVPDGYDWGRLNLQSVTEESSFQEFLSTAELAGTEFQAEKLNITFVNTWAATGVFTKEEKEKVDKTQEENKYLLSIPHRPKWDENTTPEQLEKTENEHFLEWRRRLAVAQEEKGLILTPYEKNLEFWRQLWRVVERSDIVVQIVDARSPLLFRSEELEKYVCEVSSHKQNLILLNKADYLTDTQRGVWANYFSKCGVCVAFYSATNALEQVSESTREEEEEEEDKDEDGEKEEKRKDANEEEKEENLSLEDTVAELKIKSGEYDNGSCQRDNEINKGSEFALQENGTLVSPKLTEDGSEKNINEDSQITLGKSSKSFDSSNVEQENIVHVNNSHKLLTRSELISLFHTMHCGVKVTPNITTVGLVGYPNVGKSSTINSLLLEKKVSVSATPGKTKHFQTLFLDKDLLLCDCPGLVMPSFVYSKAEMITNGILPIDQMRDHVPPITLVTNLIPRHIIEGTYGILIPPPREGEDPARPPTSEELLNAYGYNRGFMTQNGQPDNPRSARHVLKDFVNGKLLYCCAPPDHSQEDFHPFPERKKRCGNKMPVTVKSVVNSSSELDKAFFKMPSSSVHVKGYQPSTSAIATESAVGKKPWKDHSAKRNKREKLRRVYAHLDQ